MAGIRDWSTSASSNIAVGGISIAENCARANLNDAVRAAMACMRQQFTYDETAYSVLEAIPTNLHASIRDRTVNTDLKAYFDTAATAAISRNVALYVPPGTYTMTTWTPPAGLTVRTGGSETQFKQMSTSGSPQRFIIVNADNVSLWPGGSASFDGQINTIAGNATSFNSFVQVYALAGTTIERFVMGDAIASNCGGDVFECGADATGRVVDVNVGMLFGDNIYQSGASVTSGDNGYIAGFIQLGGLGFYTVNFEPNPTSPAIGSWTVGRVYGNRFSVCGDPTSTIGQVRIGQMYLDNSLADSSPAFPYDTATTSGRGGQYRWVDHLEIGQYTAKGYPYGALTDIGETGTLWTTSVYIGQLVLNNCGLTSGYEITQQRTRKFTVGSILDVAKPNASIATLLQGIAGTSLEIGGGAITGRFGVYEGAVRIKDLALDCNSATVFRECAGKLYLDNVTVTDTGAAGTLLANVTTSARVRNSTITAATVLSGTSPNMRLENTTVNSVVYGDGWLTAQAAVASAATITLPKTGDVIPISGTTNITVITADAGHAGRRVTLVFAGALTFTDGSNLKLAGNLVTTADDTITLATADGTTWYEVGRSVN